jgi:metallo-beta-lactamase class B
MRRTVLVTIPIHFIFTFLPWSSATAQENPKVQLSNEVFVEKLADGIWRHVSTTTLPSLGPVPSNGLIVKSAMDILLVDSAWNDGQTKLILDWIEKELAGKPSLAVFTHSHEDRLGGIHEIHQRGVKTLASELTAELAKQQGVESPRQTFREEITLVFGGQKLQVKYPGPGHSPDNVIVWLPDQKILFGGCLIKSVQTESLGNIADADLQQWPETIRKVYQEFQDARIVVPGHGEPSGIDAVSHTLELLEKASDI